MAMTNHCKNRISPSLQDEMDAPIGEEHRRRAMVTTNSSSTHLLFWCLHPFLWLLSAVLPMYIFFIFLPLPCLTAAALATVATWWAERCFEPRLNSSHEATLRALRHAWGRWRELSICDKPGEKEQGKTTHSFEVLTFRNDTFCSVRPSIYHTQESIW